MARGKAQVRARDGGTTTVDLKANSVFNPNASVHEYAPAVKERKRQEDVAKLRGGGVKRSGAATSDSGDYDGVYRGRKTAKTFNTGQMTRDLKDKNLQRKIREGGKPHTPTSGIADEVVQPRQKSLFGGQAKRIAKNTFARDFVFPPFSVLDALQDDWIERHALWLETGYRALVPKVLDARQGEWRARKRQGPTMGLKSEGGRVSEDIESESDYEAWGTGV